MTNITAPLLVFDFETTGLTAGLHEPIQVAAMLVTPELEVLDSFESLIRPLRPEVANPKAMEIHNKPMAELLEAPHPAEVFTRLEHFAAKAGRVILSGYNVDFDVRFLEAAEGAFGFRLDRHDGQVVDAIDQVRKHFGIGPRQRGAKLTDATSRLGIPHEAHDALGDVRATVEVMRRLRTAPPLDAAPSGPLFTAPAPAPVAALTGFVPSSYQQAIFDWVTHGQGDAFVSAVAGSGKTTTIVRAANLTAGGRVLFLAFNKHIVKELQERLPSSATVNTIHSVGYRTVTRALGRCEIDDSKYRQLIRGYLSENMVEDKDGDLALELRTLIGHVQSALVNPTDPQAVADLIRHFDLEVGDLPLAHQALPIILRQGFSIAKDQRVISYNDMLWLPHVMKLNPPTFDWVFVDEAQDLSPAQRELALKCRRPGGRMLFVGDERQAIYGFAGADSASIRTIQARTGAVRFPLSICYRCPSSHLELARKIVPEIQAAPGAAVGVVKDVAHDEFLRSVREGDLILCRLTAPLVEATFELIRMGLPARMRGTEIGKGLLTVLAKVEKLPHFSFATVPSLIDQYVDLQTAALRSQKDAETKLAKLLDQTASLKAIYGASQPRSLEEFKAGIAALFDDGKPSIMLSTVHRAKGLEEDRVFILEPGKMPHPAAKQGWQVEQEFNLKYVALTRAKRELYFVRDKKPN